MLKKINRFWMPYYDNHYAGIAKFVKHGKYQTDRLNIAMAAVTGPMLALDIGANIGIMSYWMVEAGFDVIAFEPNPELWSSFKKNVPQATLHKVACSDSFKVAKLQLCKYHTGLSRVVSSGKDNVIEVPCYKIDTMKLPKIGLVKIDVEGHEDYVLKGMVELLDRDQPVVMLEEVKPKRTAHDMLHLLGYKVHHAKRNDLIMVPR